MPFRLLHRIFLFFIRSRSPLRSFMENRIYGTIAANTSQRNLQYPPLTTRRFSANLSYFFDFAELQTHNKNRLALHINRTNFLKATKTEESVSTLKFDGRKTNAPTRIGLYVKIMQRHSAHRASERWLREAKKRGFERGAKKCRLPVYLRGFSVAKSHILTVSSA